MKWFKRILLGVLAFVVVAAAAAVAFIASIDKGFVQDLARDETGRAVTIDALDLNLLSTTPSVSLRGFTLPNAAWGTAPHAAKVGVLEAELKLMPLLSGVVDVTKIVLSDADIHVETDENGKSNLEFQPVGTSAADQTRQDADRSGRESGASGADGFSIPIIRLIDIENVAITMRDGQTGKQNMVILDAVSLEGSAPGEPLQLAIAGQALVDGQPDALPINLTGLVGSPKSMLDASIPWDLQITGDAAGLDVLVDGAIQDPTTGRGVDLAVAIAGDELADAAKIAGIDVPTIGAFDIKASALGDADGDLAINDISVNIGKPDFVRIELNGGIASATALEGVDLALKVESVDTARLSPVVRKFAGQSVPSLGPYRLTAQVLGGQSGGLAVRDIDFALGRSDLVVVNAKGAVGDVLNSAGVSGISIGFRVQSPEVGALSPIAEPYIGQPIPTLGPLNIGGVMTGSMNTGIAISDLDLVAGNENLVAISAKGAIGNLLTQSGISLDLNVTGRNTGNLSPLAEQYAGQSVPALGPFRVAAKAVGDASSVMRIDDIDVSVGALPTLLATATGSIENAMSQTGIAMEFNVSSAQVGDLEPLVKNLAGPDVNVPALGSLAVSGSVKGDVETALALSDLTLQLGDRSLVSVSASGGIANLVSQSGIGIGFKVQSDQVGNLQPIAQDFAGPDVKVPALGALDMGGMVSGDVGGVLALSDLAVDLGAQNLVAVTINGSVADLINQSGVDISFAVAGDETGNLSPVAQEMTGGKVPRLGAFSAVAVVRGDMKRGFAIDGLNVVVGEKETALLTAKGAVADAVAVKGIDLAINFESPNLSIFSGMAGGSIPAVGPVKVAGNFKGGTEKVLTFSNFLAQFGHSDLTGSASVDFQSDVPFLKAAFTSNQLNIKDIYKEEPTDPADGGTGQPGAATGDPTQPDDGRVIPNDKLPLDGLKSVNADVSVKVAQLGLTRTTMSNLELGLTLQDGDLNVSPIRAEKALGGIEGLFRLNASKEIPELAVKLKAEDLDIGVVLHMADIAPMITGPLGIDISLVGLGDNPRAIASTLGGYAKVAVVDGRAYSEAIRDEFGVGADTLISLLFGGKNSVVVECLVADYEVRGGVANTKVGVIETGVATVLIEGSTNLGNETLDLTVDPKARIAGVVGVSVPVIVGGTYADPSFTPNPGKAILGAGLGVLTGGASLGLAALLDQALPEDHPCAVLGDKQGGVQSTGQSGTGIQPAQPAQPAEPAQPQKIEDAAKDAVEGLFNNLLGN